MRQGFFSNSQLSVASNIPTISRCGICGLYRTCNSAKLQLKGLGRKQVLIVTGDEKEIRLREDSKLKLQELLRSLDVHLYKDCWHVDALRCNTDDNRLPKNKTALLIDSCRPNLMNDIKSLNPHTIILLGSTACKSLIPVIWKDKIEEFGRWPGWNIPSQKINTWVCPTYHPRLLLYQKNDLLELIVRKHLKRAFSHNKKPWEEIPNYKEQIEIIYRPSQAAKAIRDIIRNGKDCAFDFEANAIKPEEIGFEIVSCSICQEGNKTIAYPWSGEAIDASVEFFKSPVGKVGANLKYEERVAKRILNITINNWIWDCVVCAHCLDNRAGITSVKFQSFVKLGLFEYNSGIEPYFKTAKNKNTNRIREIPIRDLLLYNGLDSLIEWKLYEVQKKEIERLQKSMKGSS